MTKCFSCNLNIKKCKMYQKSPTKYKICALCNTIIPIKNINMHNNSYYHKHLKKIFFNNLPNCIIDSIKNTMFQYY